MKITTAELAIIAARAGHEANRVYCILLGDKSQPSWDEAPEWQKDSAEIGAINILTGRVTTPEQSHEAWCEHKRVEGWTYGPEKNEEKKQHPCLVPYSSLPPEQKRKDSLFLAIARAVEQGLR